jgi:hypothetical protein
MADTSEALLGKIDAKLGALLAVTLDQYLRTTGTAKPRPRAIDKLLRDAGLTSQQIADMLGKTRRAVDKALEASPRKRSASRKRSG